MIQDCWEFWNQPFKNRMTRGEVESAIEVINDYELTPEQESRVVELIQERAGRAPFKAYSAAHYIAACVTTGREVEL